MSKWGVQPLGLLQLTRVELALTAVADIWLVALLSHGWSERLPAAPAVSSLPLWLLMLCTAGVAAGLYTFAMTMNDLLDIRRDRALAPTRPIPAGQVGVSAAVVVTVGAVLATVLASLPLGPWSTLMAIMCAMLIMFYNTIGRFFPGWGILSLGLVRVMNMLVPNPWLDFAWPVWLAMTHTLAVAALGHVLERKRPHLTHRQIWVIAGGWAFFSLTSMFWMLYHDTLITHDQPWLWLPPALAAGGFILFVLWILNRPRLQRARGALLVRWGLMWLIVYDATWLLGAELWWQAAVIAALLPAAWLTHFGLHHWKLARSEPSGFRRDQPINSGGKP